MAVLINVLIILASILLILIVLVQNSKGGGLASNFSASNQVMGVRKTTDFLEKATWGLAIALVLFCLVSTMSIDRGTVKHKSAIEDELKNQPKVPMNMPATGGQKVPGGAK
jgi:preprotein translocase subunit SecG